MSNDNDPFSAFDSERTVIKPSAGRGGVRPAAPAGAPVQHAAQATNYAAAPAALPPDAAALPDLPGSAGLTPLVQAAAPLLSTGARIRVMPQHPDPAGLRAALVEGVRRFENTVRAQGVSNEQVVAARYVLCTYLDECASSTPWGGSGAWSGHSLLVLFHNEAWGGEKLFQLMGKLAQNVGPNRTLLDLLYAILALGFEGRYRVLDNGRAQLEGVREKLAQMLRNEAGAAEPELSPRWQGLVAAGGRLRDGIPVWVVACVAALVLTLVFIGLRFALAGRSDTAFTALQSLDVKAAAMPAPAPPPPVATAPRLSGFLKPEIDAGLVEVRDLADRSTVIIRGDGMFGPGSADVESRVLPLLGRIGDELARIPGPVLVTGHSDNQPIRSVRFPSNWHLSQARALAVRNILAAKVKPDRLRAEGRADGEPVDSNATPAGRAKNRRVEITLSVAASN